MQAKIAYFIAIDVTDIWYYVNFFGLVRRPVSISLQG